jgi:hypothetical protein
MTLVVNPLASPATSGTPIAISGTVFPTGDSVQVGISKHSTTPPTEYTQISASRDGLWSLSLTPNFSGNVFVWAQQVTPILPEVTLSVSRDRGYSFGDARKMSLGGLGQRKTVVQFWRLGMARDAVFRLRWSSPSRTALNGAFVEVEPSQT